jgi:hypothetical protein
VLAQKLGQLQSSVTVFSQERMDQLAYFWASLTPFARASSSTRGGRRPTFRLKFTLKFTGLTQNRWVNSKALVGIFSQTSGSTCEFWVNPVDFTFRWPSPAPRALLLLSGAGWAAPLTPAGVQCDMCQLVVDDVWSMLYHRPPAMQVRKSPRWPRSRANFSLK